MVQHTDFSLTNLVSFYLLCFFCISTMVFVSATQAIFLTDVLGIHKKLGSYTGNLTFADEVLTMILAPLWGSLSDKIGTRPIVITGFVIVGVSLFVFTVAKDVYPDLLLLRLFFAVGASASGSMITAILSEISTFRVSPTKLVRKFWVRVKSTTRTQVAKIKARASGGSRNSALSVSAQADGAAAARDPYTTTTSPLISQYSDAEDSEHAADAAAASTSAADAAATLSSEPSPWEATDGDSDSDDYGHPKAANNATNSFYGRGDVENDDDDEEFFEVVQPGTRNGKGTAMVGVMSGLGACFGAFVLVALPMELRLDHGLSPTAAVKTAYFIVGGISLFIGAALFLGLHNDRTKRISYWLTGRMPEADRVALGVHTTAEEAPAAEGSVAAAAPLSYLEITKQGFSIALEDRQIALAYCGAFIARSTTVATVMFIPLLVAANLHDASPHCASASVPASELYGTCKRGYVLSFSVMGVTQLCTLLFAPLWGYTADKFGRKVTMLASSIIGVIAFLGFGVSASTSAELILYAGGSDGNSSSDSGKHDSALAGAPGGAMLSIYLLGGLMGVAQIGSIISSMSMCTDTKRVSSGSIAGVYSLCGGLGILVLSMVGGKLADYFPGSPFIVVSVFYLVLVAMTISQMPVLKNKLERLVPEPRGGQVALTDDDDEEDGQEQGQAHEVHPAAPKQNFFAASKAWIDERWNPSLNNPSTWIPRSQPQGQIRLGNDQHFIHYDD